jgi:hypothetical protein
MSYINLMHELKTKLNNHNKFHTIVYLIHTDQYEEIETIVNDNDTIMELVQTIINEIHAVGERLEQNLNSLLWLNDMLLKFGEEAQSSITQAKKALKTIYINIFDLEEERIETRTTKTQLRKELRKHPERRFPLTFAKEHESLRHFLITM